MPDLNKVFLAGNLTRDPEVRYTPDGQAVADIGLAINRKYRGKDGQDKEDVCYVSVVAWGRQAETCGEYLSKGSPILVEGRLQFDQWEKDGQKMSKIRVTASRVQFLGSPKGEGRAGGKASRDSAEDDFPDNGPGGQPKPEASEGQTGDDDNLPF